MVDIAKLKVGETFITMHGGCYRMDADRIARRCSCADYYAQHPGAPKVTSPLPNVETYEERVIRGGTKEKPESTIEPGKTTGVFLVLAFIIMLWYLLFGNIRKG